MSLPSDRLGLTAMQTVRPPRALRALAVVLFVLFVGVPPSLFVIPWRQNVSASGRVSALDPLDRIQVIRAPVTGRLVKLNVQEGVYVEQGQVLAEMADLDVQRAERLADQVEFSREKVEAEEGLIEILDLQAEITQSAREQAIEIARRQLESARNRVDGAEQELAGARADLVQKEADFERKRILNDKGVVSGLDFQRAQADFQQAEAAVRKAEAQVQTALNDQAAAKARVDNVANAEQAKIEEIKSKREKARAELNLARKDLVDARTALERQKTQTIVAPRSGYIQRVAAATSAELISQGSELLELVPDTAELAVELWVRGVDAPLITPGREVRLQFEGTPAVQFVGWPSVAVGTYGGVVAFVDAHGNQDGMFRVLVSPDPADQPWPDRPQIRQGTRANGWLLLDSVSLGYEIWRNLNAFPPSVRSKPDPSAGTPAPTAKETSGFAPAGGGGKP